MSRTHPGLQQSRQLDVPVVCLDAELGQRFIQTVLGTESPDAQGILEYESSRVHLLVLDEDPEKDAAWEQAVHAAGALVLLVRFMDHAAMQGVVTRYIRMDKDRKVPLGVFIVREENEHEFKIGCAECHQKLWVSEQDIGKRGRCPNCKKLFLIPTQTEYLRNKLALPDAVPVLKVIDGNPALCRGALANLLARTGPGALFSTEYDPHEFLKSATVPIQVDGGALNIGD